MAINQKKDLLEVLKSLNLISKKDIRTSILLRKLFFLAHRSMGIQNRLGSSLHYEGMPRGRSLDWFENSLCEHTWRLIRRIILELGEKNIKIKKVVNTLLYNDHLPFSYEKASLILKDILKSIKKPLVYFMKNF